MSKLPKNYLIPSLAECVKLSVNGETVTDEAANFSIQLEDKKYHVSSVTIGHRSISCYGPKFVYAVFDVNNLGNGDRAVIFDWIIKE